MIHAAGGGANVPSSTTSNGQNRGGGAWRPKFAATSDNFYSDASKKEANSSSAFKNQNQERFHSNRRIDYPDTGP